MDMHAYVFVNEKSQVLACKIDTAIGVSCGMLAICIESLLKWQFCIRICSSQKRKKVEHYLRCILLLLFII